MFKSARKLVSRAFEVCSEAQDVVPEPATEPTRRRTQDELSEVRNAQGKSLWQVQNEEREVPQRILTTPYGLQL